MSKTYFISFSGNIGEVDHDLKSRQSLLNHSALITGKADEVIAWTREDLLSTDFYQQNKRILDQPRGAGFWSWKPYIILETLNKIGKDDWLIYSDSGKPFRRSDPSRAGNSKIGNVMNSNFDSIIHYASINNGFTPGIWIPHYGTAKMWSKRDCFVGMGCDSPEYHNSGQVQAGYSCWSNSKASRDFLMQWLNWVQIEAVVTDQPNIYGKPNFDEFRDHRHDQSIMTNLVIKNKIKLFGPRDHSLDGYRDFNIILRHMQLQYELKNMSTQFSRLFKGEKPALPPYLEKALSLWLLPELNNNNNVLVYNDSQRQQYWKEGLPTCNLEFGEQGLSGKEKESRFAGIFITEHDNEATLPNLLSKSYEALAPGGLLLLGAFEGRKGEAASLNGNFSELINWMFINQRFPPSLSTPENQKTNALTIGNAQNPFITALNRKQACVILRKPHFQLNA